MKRLMTTLCLLILVLAAPCHAHLISTNYYPFDQVPRGGDDVEALWVAGELGLDGVVHLGKMMETGPETDPFDLFAGGRINVDGYVDSDDDDAWVSWNLTGTGYEMVAVLLKNGRHAGATLYGVSDCQALVSLGDLATMLNPDAGGRGGISHISFFGRTHTDLPDGGTTVVLLGCALAAVALVRRIR